MLAVGYIQEDKLGMFHMTNQVIGLDLAELESIELFDFNLNTADDFFIFLEFYKITEYFVVCDGDRIHRFVRFLNSNYKISFHLFNTNLDIQIGKKSLFATNFRNMFPNKMNNQKHLIPETSSIKNELQLMLTGHYPLNIKENRIKHLYFEKIELLEHIEKSILKNCIINAVIFFDNSMTDISSELFPIMINFQRMKDTIKLINLISSNKQEILNVIKIFEASGEVLNPQHTNGMIDFSSIMNIDRNHRLFFFEDGIYRDYYKNHLITKRFDEDFYELVNFLSYKNTNIITPVLSVFPMVLNISAILKEKHMYMITPYNSYFLKECFSRHKNFSLMGFVLNEEYYIYDIYNNKNYKVNKVFLLLLEFHLKEKMDSPDLHRYIPNKLELLKRTFYEFIMKIS